MAVDFHQERQWKKCVTRVQVRSDMEVVELREKKKEVERKLIESESNKRRLASFMASEVNNFWTEGTKYHDYEVAKRKSIVKTIFLSQQLSHVSENPKLKSKGGVGMGLKRKMDHISGETGSTSVLGSEQTDHLE